MLQPVMTAKWTYELLSVTTITTILFKVLK